MPGNNPALQVKNLQVENLDISLKANVTIECCNDLFKSHLLCRVRSIEVFADQNKEVIEQLTVSGSNNYNDWLSKDILSRWKLKEFILYGLIGNISTFTSILQELTELTRIMLNDNNIDDSVIIAIVQDCPKIHQLELSVCLKRTYNSLLTLSESKLPLKELGIEYIPNIPTTDIARRCCRALSCIRSVRLETACGSKASYQLFLDLIPHFRAIALSSYNHKDVACFEWFAKRNCKIKYVTITLPGKKS